MRSGARIAWILGWAVPEAWFSPLVRAVWPDADHVFITANESAVDRLAALGPIEAIVGYSLGAHVLLASAPRVSRLGPVALLAPIFSFAREDELGSRVARAQVRHLARRLKQDPRGAIEDFYRRAGLDVPPALAPVAAIEELSWGLQRLAADRVEPPLPAGWRAWCGADDPLLDAERLQTVEPRIEIVPGATHHPAELLRCLSRAKAGEASVPTPVISAGDRESMVVPVREALGEAPSMNGLPARAPEGLT